MLCVRIFRLQLYFGRFPPFVSIWVTVFFGSPTWQLFRIQVEIPNFGRMYTWRRTHPTTINNNIHMLILFPFCFSSICSKTVTLITSVRLTAGLYYPAQENPPWDPQDGETLLPKLSPEPELTDEKVERSLSLSCSPHDGQAPLSSPELRKQRDSKTLPHFLHLNSYIGIFSSR